MDLTDRWPAEGRDDLAAARSTDQEETPRLSRRRLLQWMVGGTAATAASTLLGACGAPAAVAPTAAPGNAPAAPAAPAGAAAPVAPAPAASPAAAPAVPAAAPAVGGQAATVTLAIGGDPTSLDPQAVEEGNERTVNDNVYETLINRDGQEKIIPWLAESWTQPDPTTWRFKLRSGVKFHNGEPFNADAAAFSVKRVISPELKSQFAANLASIADAKKVDETTFDIITKQPDPSLLARLFSLRIVAPKWIQEVGAQVTNTTNGTGAYKLTSWQRGVAVDLAANDGYWGGAPKIKAARIRVIPEDQTRLSALRAGEIDIARNLLPEQLAQAPASASAMGPNYFFVRLKNLPDQESPVKDKRIRQALNYAVDKETLLKELLGGQGRLLPGQISGPEMFGFNPNLQPYPYDPARAKALLAEAGAQGLELELTGVQGRYVADALMCQAIGRMLEQAGLKVKVELLNFQQRLKLIDRKQTPNTPSLAYIGHDNTLFDADRTMTGYYTDTGSFSAYKNPELDPLIEQARAELDVKKREQAYWKIFELGREDPPGIFLLQIADMWGLSKRLQWKPVPDGRPLFKDMALA